ncbi:MAG: hypothetical protein ACOCX1_01505 [Fimbriimonadaceae bacterium]
MNVGFYGRLLNEGGQVFNDGYRTDQWQQGDQPFHPDFLALFEPFSVIRYHQFHGVSFSTESEWSDRVSPEVRLPITEYDPLPSGVAELDEVKVPYEWHVRLCNATDTDLWITLPAMASADYSRQLAELIEQNLDPELKVYVEYSNEVWNWSYADGAAWDPTPDQADGQQTYAQREGLRKFGDLLGEDAEDAFFPVAYHVVHASQQIWHEFEQVLGEDRIVRVLAWIAPENSPGERWNSFVYLTEALKEPMVMQVNGDFAHADLPDVIAVPSYFAGHYFLEPVDENEQWKPPRESWTLESAWADFEAHIDQLGANLDYAREILVEKGLDQVLLAGYEGGQHINVYGGLPQGIEVTSAEINRSPEMYDLYKKWLDVSHERLDLNVHYALVAPALDFEAFGLKETIDQPEEEAPKWRALLDWYRENASLSD